jgi:hypothetical protein
LLLPSRFNDGEPVPKARLVEAADEIMDRFGAASLDRQKIEGRWRFQGKVYRDISARIIVDVPDTLANRQWMKKFKARWKKKLDQLELWIFDQPSNQNRVIAGRIASRFACGGAPTYL